jgi:hypothetical protein
MIAILQEHRYRLKDDMQTVYLRNKPLIVDRYSPLPLLAF